MIYKREDTMCSNPLVNHALFRAKERYGIELTENHYHELCKQILDCQSDVIRIVTKTESFHYVKIAGKRLLAHFDLSLSRITTFFPEGSSLANKPQYAPPGYWWDVLNGTYSKRCLVNSRK